MRALELFATVDEQHQINLVLPENTAPGPVRVLVLVPDLDDIALSAVWHVGISTEWTAELADEREDIYTLEDGEPVHAIR